MAGPADPSASIAIGVVASDSRVSATDVTENGLQWLLLHLPVMVAAFDDDGRIIAWNAECERVTGYRADEMIGNPDALALLYPDPIYREQMLAKQQQRGDDYRAWEWDLTTKAGDVRTIAWSSLARSAPIPGWANWAMGVDVTGQRQSEAAQRESLSWLRMIVGNLPVLLFALDRHGVITLSEGQGLAALGRHSGELVGRSVFELYGDDPVALDHLRRGLAGERIATTIEVRGIILDVRYLPLHDARGMVLGGIGVAMDITERHRAENERSRLAAELTRHLRLLDAILSTTPDHFHLYDRQGRYVYASPTALRAVGLSAAEVVNKTWRELGFPADVGEAFDRRLARVFATGQAETNETFFPTVQGMRYFEQVLSPFCDEDGRVSLAVSTVRDITARRQGADRTAHLQAITAALSRALTPDEVAEVIVQKGVAALGAFAGLVSVVADDGHHLLMVRAVGHPPALVEQWPPHTLDQPSPLSDAINTGEPVLLGSRAELLTRYPILLGDLVDPRTEALVAIPLQTGGRMIGVMGLSFAEPRAFADDDTAFMLALAQQCAQALERARLYEAEQQARAEAQAAARLREEFLGIAAHELKTPLTTVKGYVQLLGRQLNQPVLDAERLIALQGALQEQVARLEGLVADLLDTARLQQGHLQVHRQPIDLTALARQVLTRFEEAPERTARHRLVLVAPAPVVGEWDAGQLDQVLTNLISNALKYSPDGGETQVRVQLAGDQAELVVSDEGVGISVEDQSLLFQPFSRSQQVQHRIHGVGLGLYISAQIVARHGGTLTVYSKPGTGSTFTVRLPLMVSSADS